MTGDPLAVHRGVMQAAGPLGLADITRDLTDAEWQLLNAELATEPAHALTLAAVDSDGRMLDEAAFAALVDQYGGGQR